MHNYTLFTTNLLEIQLNPHPEIKTPLYTGWTLRLVPTCIISPQNQDTSLIRTLSSDLKVVHISRFHCIVLPEIIPIIILGDNCGLSSVASSASYK